MTLTRDKLKNERIRNPRDAMEIHENVGKRVRSAIEEIGGTLPENIPPAEPIKKVEKRLKTTRAKLTVDPKDALGIIDHSDPS
jgi:DNA-damage-inducible protein D